SYSQTRANRSASVQRNRKRLFGRDTACGGSVPNVADEATRRRYGAHAIQRGAEHPPILDGKTDARCQRKFSREGHRVQGRYGSARSIRKALSQVRRPGPADCLCRERSKLLSGLSDWWPTPG